MRRKGLVIILDGLGDRPCPNFSGLTPLQAAHTPFLDHLAATGQCGTMDLLTPGLPVETHTGVGILLGMPTAEVAHLSRGPVEAAGIGLDLQYGDVLLRANLATIEVGVKEYRIIDRRAGRIVAGTDELCKVCQDIDLGHGANASLFPATHHRAVLRLRGQGLSDMVSDTDPGDLSVERGVLKARPVNPSDPTSELTAKLLNRFTTMAIERLESHPINKQRIEAGKLPASGVLCRGAGTFRSSSNLLSALGLRVAVIAGEKTIIGLSRLFDFTSVSDATFTSKSDTNVDGKLNQALAQLSQHDLVYVHIKGTDTASHDCNPELKKIFIEKIDQAMARSDLGELVVGVCADHSTDSVCGVHRGDPVPVLLRNPTGRRDRVKYYNEIDCSSGLLGRLSGQDWLTCLLDNMCVLRSYKPAYSSIFNLQT